LVLNRFEPNPHLLAAKIHDAEILVLTRERTVINEELLSKLPNLKLISQTGKIGKRIAHMQRHLAHR